MTQQTELSREAIYDERISPLMRQVIAICKEAGIPIYASFAIDGDLACTTYIADRSRIPEDERAEFDEWEATFGSRAKNVRPERRPMMLTVRNGEGQVTRMEAIL